MNDVNSGVLLFFTLSGYQFGFLYSHLDSALSKIPLLLLISLSPVRADSFTGFILYGTDTESVRGRYRGPFVHGNHRKQNRYCGHFLK